MVTSFYSRLTKVWAKENTAGTPILIKQRGQHSPNIERIKALHFFLQSSNTVKQVKYSLNTPIFKQLN
jgi:hypothetical protein